MSIRNPSQVPDPRTHPAPDTAVEAATRPSVSVVVPAYNEAPQLTDSLTALHDYLCTLDGSYRWELLVVNDGSTDRSGSIADDFAARHSHVVVLHHPQNRGVGHALRTAFGHCTSDYVAVMDSDLSYSPDHIGPLLETIMTTGASIVVASPYRDGAQATGVPRRRLVASRTMNRILAVADGGRLSTFTGLVRAYDGRFVRSLDLRSADPTINSEILYRARRQGAPVVEIPAHLDWTRLPVHRQARVKWSALARSGVSTLALAGRFLLLRTRRGNQDR